MGVMRRPLFIAILTMLTADASGVMSLLVPETCAIETADTRPDGGCPAFCVRCSCACCAPSIEHAVPIDGAVADLPPMTLAPTPAAHVPTGAVSEILHVPKPLLT